jgi:hypothetical protein
MGLGASIVLFAIGAILKFGISATTEGIDLGAIGVILMLVGIVGGLASALFLSSFSPYSRTSRTVVRDRDYERPVVREREVIEREL